MRLRLCVWPILALGVWACGPGPANSLEKLEGDAQGAPVGTAVAIAPSVRAVDAQGRAISGVEVVFELIDGGGTLAGAETVTDGDGVARLESWTLGPAVGSNVVGAHIRETGIGTLFSAQGQALPSEAAPLEVGTDGGVLRPSLVGTGLDGLEVTVPSGAYASPVTFKVRSEAIPMVEGFAPGEIVALVQIDNGGVVALEDVEVRIPVRPAEGEVYAAYWYRPETGRIDPAPVTEQTAEGLTIAVPSFDWRGLGSLEAEPASVTRSALSASADPYKVATAWFLVSMSRIHALYEKPIASDFAPGTDDWEFTNVGSVISPLGNCQGQTMTSAWYFATHSGDAPIRRFADAPVSPELRGQENVDGYRFVSVVTADQGHASNGAIRAALKAKDQRLNWYLLLDALRRTQQPQLVALWDTSTGQGHAVLAYSANARAGTDWTDYGEVLVADPNHPSEPRAIRFDECCDTYRVFNASLNADSSDLLFGQIRFVPHSSIGASAWTQIAQRYGELLAGTIGEVAPHSFPEYELSVATNTTSGTVENPLVDEMLVYVDRPKFRAFSGAEELIVNPFDSAGTKGLGASLPLLPGEVNDVHLWVRKPNAGTPKLLFVDFVTRRIRHGGYDVAHLGAKVGGTLSFNLDETRAFTLIGKDGSRPADIDYSEVEVQLDGPEEVSGELVIRATDFTIELETSGASRVEAELVVLYRGKLIQRIRASIGPCEEIDWRGSWTIRWFEDQQRTKPISDDFTQLSASSAGATAGTMVTTHSYSYSSGTTTYYDENNGGYHNNWAYYCRTRKLFLGVFGGLDFVQDSADPSRWVTTSAPYYLSLIR